MIIKESVDNIDLRKDDHKRKVEDALNN